MAHVPVLREKSVEMVSQPHAVNILNSHIIMPYMSTIDDPHLHHHQRRRRRRNPQQPQQSYHSQRIKSYIDKFRYV